jgi:hypothetical protein
MYEPLADAIRAQRRFTIELLYSDHEGGQRTITRFGVFPRNEAWLVSAVRHWNIDRPDPR